MAISRDELQAHLDELLASERYHDHCPNGLQVEGQQEIRSLATAATASLSSCEAAIAAGVDALLVHHGLFWGSEQRVRGLRKPRLAALLGANCNLFAYHLPLDAHPELGNNAVALDALQIPLEGRFGEHKGSTIGLWGRLAEPIGIDALIARCQRIFDHEVLHCPGGEAEIVEVGVCSGGGYGFLAEAAELGLDALITGEASEQSWHEARELGCHCLACGHHATECLAVHRLGELLAVEFELEHVALNEDNPI